MSHTHKAVTTNREHPHMVKQSCACGAIRYVERSGPHLITGRWFTRSEVTTNPGLLLEIEPAVRSTPR